ncbi:MAG: Hsp70 family protein [Prevotellaceae bacterium]|jgi:molecular chaperone DnaK (HSP70)|nr:Hsp70 family protein [Prevotellaceae bacterium]
MIYGIDLGTTQSSIARVNRFGIPEVLNPVSEGSTTTPSVVYFDENDMPVAGAAAKDNWFGARPERTVICIKRMMSNPRYVRRIGSLNLDPVTVSAHILRKLTDDANLKLRNEENLPPVKEVVITVPAYFGELERRRTVEAGHIAGLDVVELIAEPDAAALAYFSLDLKNMDDKTILVYDLGGGTFDASIVKIRGGKPETIGIGGDSKLGGFDWDMALANLALQHAGIHRKLPDPELFAQDDSTLLLAAERCKKALSEPHVRSSMLSFVYDRERYNINIGRIGFEAATGDLLDRTRLRILEAARRADARSDKPADEPAILNRDDSLRVDEVILVGGASRMPMAADMIRSRFGKEPKLIDPDLAVAKGAALYAHILRQPETKTNAGRPRRIESRGSRSYGLGIEISGGKKAISNLIKLTEPMLIVNRRFEGRYALASDSGSANIGIYENESDSDIIDRGERTPVKVGVLEFETVMPKSTPVSLLLSRDVSGIVSLKAACGGKEIKIRFETV